MEVVSEPLVLAGTAAAHLQDDLSSRMIYAHHRNQIYSPRDLICLEKSSLLIRAYQGQLKKIRVQTPRGIT